MLLGFVGLVPWLAVLDRTRFTRTALITGLAMCSAFSLAVFGWFADAIADYASIPRALAWLLLALGAPTLQPQLVVFAVARRPLRRELGMTFGTLAAALVYVGVEWLWPKVFADTLGHGLHASAVLRQAADVAGAPGLTFALLIVNESLLVIATSATRDRRVAGRALAVAIGVVLVLAVYGAYRRADLVAQSERHDARTVTAALIQASITGYEELRRTRGTFGAVEWILKEHVALSDGALEGAGVDLVVWPETVYPTTFGRPKSDDGRAFDAEITGFVERTKVPLLFGSYDVDGADEYNAAFLVEPNPEKGDAPPAYRKTHLFPLTEYVPSWLESETARRMMPWLGTWQPGPGPRVLEVRLRDGNALRFAPLICLDAVVANHSIDAASRGAEVLVTLSNDSWFAETPGAHLHLVVSAFRSIETRRPQLRVTNSGISAIIDASGELTATTNVGERRALVGTVSFAPAADTLMLRWGDWFGPSAFIGGAAALLLAMAARRARRSH
jgi:apolipoprotein N-acyltransferase